MKRSTASSLPRGPIPYNKIESSLESFKMASNGKIIVNGKELTTTQVANNYILVKCNYSPKQNKVISRPFRIKEVSIGSGEKTSLFAFNSKGKPIMHI